MIDNISRLYELAGVEKITLSFNIEGKPIKGNIPFYPPFTAEKQLELIKWLVTTRPIHISSICGYWIVEGMIRYNKKYPTFEQALVSFVIHLYQDLTDDQKQEIKRILE